MSLFINNIFGLLQDRTVMKVLCNKLGESRVALSMSNSPSIPKSVNKDTVFNVKVVCGKPRSIELKPELKIAEPASCPMDLGSDKLVVHSSNDIELNVIVLDDQGRRFQNISSLKLAWTMNQNGLVEMISKYSSIER